MLLIRSRLLGRWIQYTMLKKAMLVRGLVFFCRGLVFFLGRASATRGVFARLSVALEAYGSIFKAVSTDLGSHWVPFLLHFTSILAPFSRLFRVSGGPWLRVGILSATCRVIGSSWDCFGLHFSVNLAFFFQWFFLWFFHRFFKGFPAAFWLGFGMILPWKMHSNMMWFLSLLWVSFLLPFLSLETFILALSPTRDCNFTIIA